MIEDASIRPRRSLERPDGDIIVRPVPEHRADAELKPVYQDLKATLGVPWVGVITQAVAYFRPAFLEAWRQFHPSARSHFFESRADAIRLTAWEQVGSSFEVPPVAQRLQAMGYSDNELTQIRAVLDIFDYGNPKYLVFATAIQQSLCEGRQLGGGTPGGKWDTLPRSPIYQIDPDSGHGGGAPCRGWAARHLPGHQVHAEASPSSTVITRPWHAGPATWHWSGRT